MITPLYFSEILASRLCHDFVAPLGAIQTGLELLTQTPPSHLTEFKEILNLILRSTESATTKTSFFRAAFGASGNTLSLPDIKTIAENYLTSTKLEVSWKDTETPSHVKGWGRLLLNLILWCSECTPRGGTLEISFSHTDPFTIFFHLKGEALVFHKGTLEALQTAPTADDLSPRNIPCYLIHYLVEEKKATLSLEQSPAGDEVQIKVQSHHLFAS